MGLGLGLVEMGFGLAWFSAVQVSLIDWLTYRNLNVIRWVGGVRMELKVRRTRVYINFQEVDDDLEEEEE